MHRGDLVRVANAFHRHNGKLAMVVAVAGEGRVRVLLEDLVEWWVFPVDLILISPGYDVEES